MEKPQKGDWVWVGSRLDHVLDFVISSGLPHTQGFEMVYLCDSCLEGDAGGVWREGTEWVKEERLIEFHNCPKCGESSPYLIGDDGELILPIRRQNEST